MIRVCAEPNPEDLIYSVGIDENDEGEIHNFARSDLQFRFCDMQAEINQSYDVVL